MADSTFIQNSRIGRCTFQLRNGQLEVSGLSGGRIEKTFALRSLSQDYSRKAKHVLLLFLVPGFVVIVGLTLIILLLNQNLFPREFALYPAIYVAFGMVGLVRATPRVEYFQFNDHWKHPAFFIIREKAQAQECDDYVRLLVDQIEKAQNGDVFIQTKAAAISTVFLPNPGDSYFVGETRWQVSLVLGSIAFGVPLIPKSAQVLEGDLFFYVVFAFSFTSLACAFLSYQSKERFRHVALVGAVLSLLAIYL